MVSVKGIEFLSFPEIIAMNVDDPPEIIHGIFCEGEVGNLIAGPKSRKSWLVLDLAIAVQTGGPWLGQFDTIQGDVLIVDNELPLPQFRKRIKAVCEARGTNPDSARVEAVCLRGQALDVGQILDLVRERGKRFKLIVIDALYQAIPANVSENDNIQMTGVYKTLTDAAKEIGAGILIVHHTPKGDQSKRPLLEMGSGASAIARAVDLQIGLRPHHNRDSTCAVFEAKPRSYAEVEPVSLRFTYPVWNIDESLPVIREKAPRTPRRGRESKITEDIEIVAQALATGPKTMRALRDTTRFNQARCRAATNAGVVSGRFEKTRGQKWDTYALACSA
jgi:hypothetical protein